MSDEQLACAAHASTTKHSALSKPASIVTVASRVRQRVLLFPHSAALSQRLKIVLRHLNPGVNDESAIQLYNASCTGEIILDAPLSP